MDIEKQREYARKYYHEHKEEMRAYHKKWVDSQPEQFKKSARAAEKKNRASLKESVFTLLGNKCARCGFDDRRALQIDHIKGGGNQERKLFPSNNLPKYWRHILEVNGEGYQLLCANCNWIKRNENQEDN